MSCWSVGLACLFGRIEDYAYRCGPSDCGQSLLTSSSRSVACDVWYVSLRLREFPRKPSAEGSCRNATQDDIRVLMPDMSAITSENRRRRLIERLFMNTFIHIAPPCNRLLDDLTISHRRVTALHETLISAAELLDDKRAGAPPQVISHRRVRVTCGWTSWRHCRFLIVWKKYYLIVCVFFGSSIRYCFLMRFCFNYLPRNTYTHLHLHLHSTYLHLYLLYTHIHIHINTSAFSLAPPARPRFWLAQVARPFSSSAQPPPSPPPPLPTTLIHLQNTQTLILRTTDHPCPPPECSELNS